MISFESNIENVYGDKGKVWLAQLPTLVPSLASRLKLCELKPISNLTYNYGLSGF
jgi:streptomycin 6-kinase